MKASAASVLLRSPEEPVIHPAPYSGVSFTSGARSMSDNPNFVRKPHEADPTLIFSMCTRCQALIGAASSLKTIKAMEDNHQCPFLQQSADVTKG